MFQSILSLLIPVADIIDKKQPGFAASTQIKINNLRTAYEAEMGKKSSDIDDAMLASLELQLCELIQLSNTALQPTKA
jgi:hypothetical protein